MADLVTYDLSDRIATITMDDGKVNVMSTPMTTAIGEALDQAEKDAAVVVLTGREGVFSAGFDLNVFKNDGPEASRLMLKTAAEVAERIMAFPYPVVAAVTGHAIAMGAFMMMPADVRIGAAGNFKIGANEVTISMTVPYFALAIIKHRLSPAHYNLAATTGRFYSPEEALPAGWLDQVVPADAVLSTAQTFAGMLTQIDMGSHHATKLRVRADALKELRHAIETELTAETLATQAS